MRERLKSGKRQCVSNEKINVMKINLIAVLVSMLAVYLSGCESISTKYVGTDSLASRYDNDSEDVVARIAGVILKDSTVLDLNEKNPEISSAAGENQITYDVNNSKRAGIPFDKISLVKLTIVKSKNPGPLAVLLTFVAAGIIAALVSLHHIHQN